MLLLLLLGAIDVSACRSSSGSSVRFAARKRRATESGPREEAASAPVASEPDRPPPPKLPPKPVPKPVPKPAPQDAHEDKPVEAAAAPSETQRIAIPAGEFWIGAEAKSKSVLPRRLVKLAAFEIDRSEVTAEAYDACVQAGACTPAKTGGTCTSGSPAKRDHPINCVRFTQARAFCERAGARLPTELEWERAARGPEGRVYAWGDAWPPPARSGNFADRAAKLEVPYLTVLDGYDDGFATTAPVSSFAAGASSEGVLDIAGNVAEWTEDLYSDRGAPVPPRPSAAYDIRVVRGSSYGQHRREELALYFRTGYRADVSSTHIGFRCARSR